MTVLLIGSGSTSNLYCKIHVVIFIEAPAINPTSVYHKRKVSLPCPRISENCCYSYFAHVIPPPPPRAPPSSSLTGSTSRTLETEGCSGRTMGTRLGPGGLIDSKHPNCCTAQYSRGCRIAHFAPSIRVERPIMCRVKGAEGLESNTLLRNC